MFKKFFVLIICISTAISSMEYQWPEVTKRDFSAVLPQDVQVLVVDNLLRPHEMVKSFKDIIAVSRVNKSLNKLLRQDKRFSIQRITQKMEMYQQGVVFHLIQLGALKASLLNDYIDASLNQKLWIAVLGAKVHEVQDLLSKKANPHTLGNELLRGTMSYMIKPAKSETFFTIGTALLKAGAQVNSNFIHHTYAASLSHSNGVYSTKFARLLFSAGLDVNTYVYAGSYFTLLICAILKQRIEHIEMILEQQPDLTLQDDEGKTAYDIAVDMGYTEIAELIKSKMDL